MGKRTFLQQVLVLVSGTTAAQGLVIVTSPILTRLYSPKDFGILAVYISVLSVFSLLGTLQYENAIPLPEDEKTAINLVVLSATILMGVCMISGLILWILKEKLTLILQITQVTEYLWLLPFSLFGIGLYNILYRWNMRGRFFNRIAQTKVTQSFGMVGTQIIGGAFWHSPTVLLIGDVIGRVSGSGRLSYLFFKEVRTKLGEIKLSEIKLASRKYKNFPLMSGWSALLKELSDQLPSFFLIIGYGPQVVGWYMLVHRTLALPLSLIGYSVGNVFMAEILALKAEQSPEKVLELYWKTLRNLFFFSFPVLLCIAFAAKWAFPVIFGNGWSMAGNYVLILLPMYQIQFLAIPLSSTLYALERQGLQLIREGVRFTLLIAVLVCLKNLTLMPTEVISWISAVGFFAFIINVMLSWLALKQYCRKELAILKR